MRPAKRTFAIVVLTTTLVSCSNQMPPATTPAIASEPLRIDATTGVLPLVMDLTVAYSGGHSRASFETHQANSQVMLDGLLAGERAYFMTNHLPVNDLWAAPIGQDGIAIVANPGIDIEGLTTEQLRMIYQGRITNWSEIGGAEQDINVFSRENGSGTRAEFERIIMGRRQTTPDARIAPSSGRMIESVAEVAGGIGYVSVGYLDNSVRVLAINDVEPTPANIAANRYPLRSTLFVVGLEAPQGEYLAFISWIQSPQGQQVVARRYAPLFSPEPAGH
jgi:phosphate transport system substrate-binding protein